MRPSRWATRPIQVASLPTRACYSQPKVISNGLNPIYKEGRVKKKEGKLPIMEIISTIYLCPLDMFINIEYIIYTSLLGVSEVQNAY